jgi:phage FluMu protein gp41
MVYVPKALSELAAEHVAGTQASEALLAEISQLNLELLRRRALE